MGIQGSSGVMKFDQGWTPNPGRAYSYKRRYLFASVHSSDNAFVERRHNEVLVTGNMFCSTVQTDRRR